MTDVRAKLAALRERRAAREQGRRVTDTALQAVNAATWDRDFKERLAGNIVSEGENSDSEEDCALVVLPPPTLRLDPSAQRTAWRQKQVYAAKERANQLLKERYPAFENVQPLKPEREDVKTEVENPPDDVQDEEELLMEEEEDDEEEEEDEIGDDDSEKEAGEDGQNADDMEEAQGENKSCSGEAEGEQDVLAENENGEAHEVESDEKESTALSGTASEENASEGKTPSKTEARGDVSDKKLDAQPQSEVQLGPTFQQSSKPKSPDAALSQKPESTSSDSPNVTHRTPLDSTKMNSPKAGAPAKTTTTSNFGDAFARLFARTPAPVPAPITTRPERCEIARPSAFIDDEAEDDGEEHEEISPTVRGCTPEMDDSEEEGNDVVQDVVEDTPVPQEDVGRLAKFHREWERKNDGKALCEIAKECNAQTAMSGAIGDVDNAMDLTELIRKDKDKDSLQGASENDDCASVCRAASMDRSAEIADVDALFRDNDSNSMFIDEEEDKDLENGAAELRKKQARALWKARQRYRSRTGLEDENSLSKFDLFGGGTQNDRTNRYRAQIEKSVKPARPQRKQSPVKEKRKSGRRIDPPTINESLPEWERRRKCLERVEKRRRTAVCIDKWSFAPESRDNASTLRQLAPGDRKMSSRVPKSAPVGGSAFTGQRGNPVVELRRQQEPSAKSAPKAAKTKKKASSFRQLFDVLGERATADVS